MTLPRKELCFLFELWESNLGISAICNLSNRTAISAIRLQSQQSDCNLCNQNKTRRNMAESLCRVVAPYVSCGTFAISAIRLQSLQSDCNLSNQKKTPPNMPESLCRVVAPYVSCGTFAISAIRLQSQQSDCNLSNQTAISTIRLQSPQSDCNLILQSVDCIWITQRERFNTWEMFWKYWHMAFIRLLGLLGFDCFRITWRLHQIALDYWDCT